MYSAQAPNYEFFEKAAKAAAKADTGFELRKTGTLETRGAPYRHYGEHEFFAGIGDEIVVWMVPQTERLQLAARAAVRAFEASGKMRDAALAYAAHGFAVFPLDINSKKPIPARDKDANGNPIPGTGGVYKATCDPLIIRAWWREHPRALIGLPMGPVSGVWCLDVDTSEDHADGVAAWNEIAAQHESIVTREHRSATGGPHLIFNWDRMSEEDLPRRLSKYDGDHVTLKRIALKSAHVRGLPSFPATDKKKDPRYNWFRANHGDRCWSLRSRGGGGGGNREKGASHG